MFLRDPGPPVDSVAKCADSHDGESCTPCGVSDRDLQAAGECARRESAAREGWAVLPGVACSAPKLPISSASPVEGHCAAEFGEHNHPDHLARTAAIDRSLRLVTYQDAPADVPPPRTPWRLPRRWTVYCSLPDAPLASERVLNSAGDAGVIPENGTGVWLILVAEALP